MEVDKNGRVVAYYISNTYPHQITTEKQEWTRVPAYGERTGLPNILHIMDSERPDQYRGVPYLAQVIEPLLQLRRYTESELMAALVQSFFTAWIETETDPSGTPFNEVGTGDIAGVPTASPDGAGASNISDDPNEYEMGPGNAIAQAYQEQLTEIYSKNADVLIEAEKNKIGLRDAEGKLAVAQKAQNDEFERQNRLYQEANQKVQEYYEETGLVTDANMWLGETTDELNWKLEQNAQAVMEAQDAVDAYQKAIDTVGIELLRCVAAVICKLFNQIFVPLAELVLRAVGNRQCFRAEVLQQVFQKPVGKTILIGPSSITEDALQLIRVRIFNLPECLNDSYAYIFRNGTDVIPVITLRNNKGMDLVLIKFGCIITVLFDSLSCFFVVHITDTLEEEERENVLLIGTSINIGSEKNRRVPEIGLQFFDCYSLTH